MPEIDLDDLFAQARAAAPLPSAGLIDRIEADALAEQARRSVVVAPRRRRRGFWTGVAAALGGGGVLTALASATLAGVWVGIANPEPLSALTSGFSVLAADETGFDEVELIPTDDPFLTEG